MNGFLKNFAPFVFAMRALSRGALCRAAAAAALATTFSSELQASAFGVAGPRATVVSLTEGGGGALCVAFTLDGVPFRAILDTGSPFLTVPAEADCDDQPRRVSFFGCAPDRAFRASAIVPSVELYGVTEAEMRWRSARLSGLVPAPQDGFVFGAAPRPLVEASGGVFAGLILNGDGLHPTLLAQLEPPVTGFVLSGPDMELRLLHAAGAPSCLQRDHLLHRGTLPFTNCILLFTMNAPHLSCITPRCHHRRTTPPTTTRPPANRASAAEHNRATHAHRRRYSLSRDVGAGRESDRAAITSLFTRITLHQQHQEGEPRPNARATNPPSRGPSRTRLLTGALCA